MREQVRVLEDGRHFYALLRPRLTPHVAGASPSQLCSLKQISPCTHPRAGIARFTLAVDLCCTKHNPEARARLLTSCNGLQSWLVCMPRRVLARLGSGPGTLRAALHGMRPAAGDGGIRLNSAESPPCCGCGIRSHRQLRGASKAAAPPPKHAIDQRAAPHEPC